jgi:hypothetical protein
MDLQPDDEPPLNDGWSIRLRHVSDDKTLLPSRSATQFAACDP